MKPRVDIIVPCYNYAEYLPVCVESLLSQTGVDVRALILDDCSSDDSATVGAGLAARDPRITFRRHTRNHGHIATYNEGIEWVEAPYLLLISADDLLTPGALARATEMMEANPAVGMVHGRQITFSTDPHLPPDFAQPGGSVLPGEVFVERVCAGGENPVATPTVVARTVIQRVVGGYESSLPHTADLEMWLRFASLGAVGQLSAFQAFKRGHDRNMQHDYVRRAVGDLSERYEAFQLFLSRAECPIADRDGLRATTRRALASSAFWRASHLFDTSSLGDAEELLDLAIRFDPDFAQRPEWRKMRIKRWLGPRVWRSLAGVINAVSSLNRQGERDRGSRTPVPGQS